MANPTIVQRIHPPLVNSRGTGNGTKNESWGRKGKSKISLLSRYRTGTIFALINKSIN
jgi:hypothetical protein